MLASIIIRTLNEARHLGDLLEAINYQETNALDREVIVVDSGSTDASLEIAHKFGCKTYHITREEFTFGRSLNLGCERATGDVLVFISGHCVPVDAQWLENLCRPVLDGRVAYTYGRQIGDDDSYYSERRVFAKYFPATSAMPQTGFYCNNANSALAADVWREYRFDEELTGLEDMDLAKRLVQVGRQIGYSAEACVFHHHQESWSGVRRRFEREAIALQKIMPEVQLSLPDVGRYVMSSISADWVSAWRNGQFGRSWLSILQYRTMQYLGAYAGNHQVRKLSRQQQELFYYPSPPQEDAPDALGPNRRRATYEVES